MKVVAQVAIGIVIAGVVLYGAYLVVDTRARVVSTHVMTSEIYGRVFPERVQPQKAPAAVGEPPAPSNQSPPAPKE